MKVHYYVGTEEFGAIGTFKISKIGHCRYQAEVDPPGETVWRLG